MTFIGPGLITDLRALLTEFMPDTVSIKREVGTQGPGGQTTTETVIGTTICRIEEVPRPIRPEDLGDRVESEPIMQMSYPVGTDLLPGDKLTQTANVMGPVVNGTKYQVTSVIPEESYDVESHAWLKVLQF